MAGAGGTIAVRRASFGSEASFVDDRNELRYLRNIVRLVRTLSPRKPAASLSAWTGLSKRQCENILAERSGLSGPALRRLLTGPHSLQFAEAFFDSDLPDWFVEGRYAWRAAQARADLIEARAARNHAKRKA